jgi:hypothetical protein
VEWRLMSVTEFTKFGCKTNGYIWMSLVPIIKLVHKAYAHKEMVSPNRKGCDITLYCILFLFGLTVCLFLT